MSVPTWAEKLIVQHGGEDALSQKWADGVQNGEMGYLEAMKHLNKYFVFVVGNKSPKQTLALLTFRTLESGDTLVEDIELDHASTFVRTYGSLQVPHPKSGKLTSAVKLWLEYPDARRGRLIFSPKRRVGIHNGELNLYMGLRIQHELLDCGLQFEQLNFDYFNSMSNDALKADFDFIFKHIKDTLCGGKEELYQYHINLLKYIVQHLGSEDKLEVSEIFYSVSQGVGKNLYFENFVGRKMFGKHNYASVKRIDELFADFNDSTTRKLWITIEEVSKISHKKTQLLKDRISSTKVAWRRKYCDPFEIDDFAHFIFLSNELPRGFVEASDRRFFVSMCSSSNATDTTYRDNMVRAFLRKDEDGEDDDALVMLFYLWLMNTPIADGFDPRKIPASKPRETLREEHRNDVVQFLQHLAEKKELPGKIKHSDLYKSYEKWCSEESKKPAPSNQLSTYMDAELDAGLSIKRRKLRWSGNPEMTWCFDFQDDASSETMKKRCEGFVEQLKKMRLYVAHDEVALAKANQGLVGGVTDVELREMEALQAPIDAEDSDLEEEVEDIQMTLVPNKRRRTPIAVSPVRYNLRSSQG
jgi:hypothetical protein